MAKQRKDSNVVDLIEPAPEGFNATREVWASTPAVIRSETIRMYRELSERIPIERDRRSDPRPSRQTRQGRVVRTALLRARRDSGKPGEGCGVARDSGARDCVASAQ